MKKLKGLSLLLLIAALVPATVFAGEWRAGAAPNECTATPDGAWTEAEVVETIAITIKVGDRQFAANLLDNASTQALIGQMPLTLNMSDLNGNEKYYYLSPALPTDTQSIGTIHNGDLMLYGSDCLVLFYEDFSTSYRYTRLGTVSDPSGLEEALGAGSVAVTFSKN